MMELISEMVSAGIWEEQAAKYLPGGKYFNVKDTDFFPNGHDWTEALCLAIRDGELVAVKVLATKTDVDLENKDHVSDPYCVKLNV